MEPKTTKKSSRKLVVFKRELPFYLMLIPGVTFLIIFSYLPMFGLVMAFQDFTPLRSFKNSPWVGLKNFRDMLALPTFWNVVGNTLSMFPNPNTVGVVQSICLAIITIGTFVYTLFKARIQGKHITNPAFCVIIGLVLGLMSSFLGIGGGPINLVVLFYFFSMETKTAAQNSLYIILFSQITSLLTTLITHSVPEFTLPALVLMIAGGIGGGIAGRTLNKRMSSRAVDKLFLVLIGVIILISIYNAVHYMGI